MRAHGSAPKIRTMKILPTLAMAVAACAALAGALLGFLPHNLKPGRPAAIFLGDSGSASIGFLLAALAIKEDWAEAVRSYEHCEAIYRQLGYEVVDLPKASVKERVRFVLERVGNTA